MEGPFLVLTRFTQTTYQVKLQVLVQTKKQAADTLVFGVIQNRIFWKVNMFVARQISEQLAARIEEK